MATELMEGGSVLWWLIRTGLGLCLVTAVLFVAGRKKLAAVPSEYVFKNYFIKGAYTEQTHILENPGRARPGRPKRKLTGEEVLVSCDVEGGTVNKAGQAREGLSADVGDEHGPGDPHTLFELRFILYDASKRPSVIEGWGDVQLKSKAAMMFAGPSEPRKRKARRFFQKEWLNRFPWLSYDEAKDTAYCEDCKASKKNNVLARGLNFSSEPNFRKDSFVDHEKSQIHKDAVMRSIGPEIEHLGLKDGNISTCFEKARLQGLEGKLKQLQAAFLVGKLGSAVTSSYPIMKSLAALWGVKVPEKHWSPDSAWELTEALSFAEREVLKESLAEADEGYAGVIVDDSTAIDNTQYLAIAIVWCRHAMKKVRFLALRHVAPATGEVIANLIVKELKDIMPPTWDIQRHLVSVGCDGASVMLGEIKGVTGILKSGQAPFVISMHCAAHKISLACKGFDQNRVYQAIDDCLRACYNLFSRSPSMKQKFKAYQQIFDNDRQLLRNHDIRWLSMYRVLERWLAQYDALLIFLVSEGLFDASLERVGEIMLDAEVFLGSRALKPLLEKLQILIKEIQGVDFSFEDLSKRIETLQRFINTNYNLEDRKEFADEAFRKLLEIQESPSRSSPLSVNGERVAYTSVGHGSYHFLTYQKSMIYEENWEVCVSAVLEQVCDLAKTLAKQLVERFPHKGLLNALTILQASYWEKPQVVNLEDSIEFLADFYGTEKVQLLGPSHSLAVAPLIDGDLLRGQAKRFGEVMVHTVPAISSAVAKQKQREKVALDRAHGLRQSEEESEVVTLKEEKGLTEYLWAYLVKSGEKQDISEFVKLAIIMLIIPVSSVQAERLFSCMNFLKNDRRNRLGEDHLNDCVRLKMSDYTLEKFPYDKALDYFLRAKLRRGLTAGPPTRALPRDVDINEHVLDAILIDGDV